MNLNKFDLILFDSFIDSPYCYFYKDKELFYILDTDEERKSAYSFIKQLEERSKDNPKWFILKGVKNEPDSAAGPTTTDIY